jgi:predicted DCC family thiol-disulfide oxidoreductase YuxK
MMFLVRKWNQFWFTPGSADNLGLCRVVFFLCLIAFYAGSDFSGWGSVSLVFWRPIFFFYWLHIPLLSVGFLHLLQAAWKCALVLACLGCFTRLSTTASFVLGFYLIGLPKNFRLDHTDALVVLTLLVLAFSRCGDAWSIDSLIRAARRPQEHPPISGEYTWPVRAVWALLALMFMAAAVSKLRHAELEWVTSQTMAIWLVTHNYGHIQDPATSWGLFLAQHTWVTHVIAAGTIAIEAAYPLALFNTRARWLLVPSALLMQLGIRLLMGPAFYPQMFCNVFWIPWDRVAARLMARPQRQSRMVLFDGYCGLCNGTVGVVKGLDILQRVVFWDVTQDWDGISHRYPQLDLDSCLKDMHVIDVDGQITTAFYAYRSLAWVLPAAWVVLPLLYLPGIPWIGSRVYAYIASRRSRACAYSPGAG